MIPCIFSRIFSVLQVDNLYTDLLLAHLKASSMSLLDQDYYLSALPEDKRAELVTLQLTIPLKSGDEVVTIDFNEDVDVSQLCVLLESENARPDLWLSAAKVFVSKGNISGSQEIIRKALQSNVILDSSASVTSLFHNFSFWLSLMEYGSTNSREDQFLEYASNSLQASNSLDSGLILNGIGNGVLYAKSRRYEEALKEFDNLLKKKSTNILAILGKAQILYKRQKYSQALELYQKALTINPLIVPDPRLGIGLCFWHLNNKQLAEQAWHNSLKVHPKNNFNTKILICLAKFDHCFNESKDDDEFTVLYRECLGFIQSCLKEQPKHPLLLMVLASYYFSKEDFEKVEKLCNLVLKENSRNAAFVSASHFWLARVAYHKEDHVQAQKQFKQAEDSQSSNTLAKLGYAQCLIARNEIGDATIYLEKFFKENQDSKASEMMLLLGIIYSQSGKSYYKAIQFLEKYVAVCQEEKYPILPEAYLVLSRVYENKDLSVALDYLMKANDSLGGKANIYVLNNLGIYHFFRNNIPESADFFAQSLEALNNLSPQNKEALSITLQYNKARLEEVTNQPEAEKLYSKLMEKCPGYTSNKIRYIYLLASKSNGNNYDDIQQLLNDFPSDLEVRSFYGWFLKRYGRKNGLKQDLESQHHKDTLVKYDKHDCYALLSLGNIYATIAREMKVTDQKQNDIKRQQYLRAAQFYHKVLSIDPKNIYAAQGIAIIFSDKERTGLALEIFKKVRDTVQDLGTFINLGHCFMEAKQFGKAIESYTIALEKFSNGMDSKLLVLIGRAWYHRGFYEKSLDAYRKALEVSEQAYQLSKLPALRFNIVFIQFQIADFVKSLPNTQRDLTTLENALSGLNDAIESLLKLAELDQPPYPSEDLKARATMGSNTLRNQLERAIQDQQDYEMSIQEKLRTARRKQQLDEEKRLEQEQKRLEEAKKRQEAELIKRQELIKQAEEWNNLDIDAAKDNHDVLSEDGGEGEKKTSKKRKRKQKASEDIAADVDDQINEENGKTEDYDPILDNEEEENYDEKESEDKENGQNGQNEEAYPDSDGDDEDGLTKTKRQKKSKGIVDDEDFE
ncbi:BA75_03467T0 [Komagataella pastoris]|uniref:BA75_03467T0 n=1 Tax=Komagataella pastoris TaxID=4922 RepID=A0A1B2JEF0_PICPA|nr:BA75_03467T0 [Komagataella pastoris]